MSDKGTGFRKVIKNPFAKIHQAAIDNGGSLPDNVRKEMMKEACEEQNRYKMSMSFEEMVRKQNEYDEKMGNKPLSLDEINQCIKEVRNGCK